ncbi:MAG: hypothetical protein MJE63_22500, partial [Proteobacteria bacterium]|nr:hypothetical protein [Pseudomonadota bacterium]
KKTANRKFSRPINHMFFPYVFTIENEQKRWINKSVVVFYIIKNQHKWHKNRSLRIPRKRGDKPD